jgi:hypothetical protein
VSGSPSWSLFVDFARSRPASVRELMRAWPPLCTVRTRPHVTLLVPAPGVDGRVESYTEDGRLGVVAPITIPHPEHGYGMGRPGMLAKGMCAPTDLVLVDEPIWTRADVARALEQDTRPPARKGR